MTLIDFGDFKLRFDPKEVRISIDGEIIDVGARRDDEDDKDRTFIVTGGARIKKNQSDQK